MSLGLDNLSSRYVYRVLRPDEDPREDLSCKDSSSKLRLELESSRSRSLFSINRNNFELSIDVLSPTQNSFNF